MNTAKLLAAFLLAFGASSAFASDKAVKDEPRYDATTIVAFKATVTGIREATITEPFDGLYLSVKSDNSLFKTLEVYVGPADFVKAFEITFAKGDEIEVIGSKLKVDGAALVLAREVTRKETTLILRDKNGEPFWKHWTKAPPK